MLNALRPGALFANADYRRLWAAGALTGVGRWLEFIALGIYAYEVTGSPPLVALLSVMRMMPYVALGFFVGALADRFDRRRLMMAGTAIICATAAFMCAATSIGWAGYAAVAVATMMSGAFWTIDMPVRRRLLVDAIGSADAPRALGFDNSTTYATRAIGPLAGGATYQVLGIGGIYALIAASYLICFVLAWRLGAPADDGGAGRKGDGFFAALSIPPSLIFNRKFAVIMGVTIVYNVTCFPFTTMVPVIAQKDFLLAPSLVGALSACDGLGGVAGALIAGSLATDKTLFRFYFVGVTTILALILALSFHLTVEAAVPMLLISGVAAAWFSATQYALVYTISPPEVRGRATGVLSIFIGTSMFGHYLAGQLFGVLPSPQAMRIMASGGMAAMVVLGLLWWLPRDSAPTVMSGRGA